MQDVGRSPTKLPKAYCDVVHICFSDSLCAAPHPAVQSPPHLATQTRRSLIPTALPRPPVCTYRFMLPSPAAYGKYSTILDLHPCSQRGSTSIPCHERVFFTSSLKNASESRPTVFHLIHAGRQAYRQTRMVFPYIKSFVLDTDTDTIHASGI